MVLPAALGCGENLRVASLLVITGPPGAGKSPVATLVAKHSNPSVLIEGHQAPSETLRVSEIA